MLNGIRANDKPIVKLLISFFTIFLVFSVFISIAIIIALPIFGIDLNVISGDIANYSDPENLPVIKFFQIVQSIGLFIIPPFILAYLFHGNIKQYLYLDQVPGMTITGILLLTLFFSAPVVNFLAEINEFLNLPDSLSGIENWMKKSEKNARDLTELFLRGESLKDLMLSLFMVAILPAIGEELIFRGIFQRLFTDLLRNKHMGILFSATLFSAFHLQFYGFLPRLFLGVYFGYILLWSKNMWYPIIAHFINNALAIFVYFFAYGKQIQEEVEQVGTTDHYFYLLPVSVLIFIFLIWQLRQQATHD